MIFDERALWFLHYDNEGGGDPNSDPDPDPDPNPDPDPTPSGKEKSFNEEEVNKIVAKRTEKARSAQKKALERMQQLEQTVKMTEEERETLRSEIEELQQSTLSSTEITKREAKKTQEKYDAALDESKKESDGWQSLFNDLKINYEIISSANEHGVLEAQVPFLEAFLRPNTKNVEHKDEDGELTGKYVSQVVFQDSDGDGNPIEVQMTVPEVVKRMKELPDKYGHLFESHIKGGTGTTTGKANRGPGKDIKNLSQADYMKLRKEDPEKIYGSV